MRRLLVVGVVVACLVEGLLLVKLLRDQPEGSDAGPVATATAEEPADEPTPTAQEPVGVQRIRLSDDGYIVRSWRGSCSEAGRAKLEISTDGGVSFDEVALPVLKEGAKAPVVRALLNVSAESRDEITIVGSDKTCATKFYRTKDGGKSWDEQDQYEGWYLNATGSEVGIDGTVTRPGCTVVRIAPVNEQNAKVLCDNGDVLGTNDLGEEWAVLGSLPDGTDISFASLRDGVGVQKTADCDVQLVSTGDAGGTWDDVSCVVKKSDRPADTMTSSGGYIVVQVDGVIYVSTDAGDSWKKAGTE